MGVGRGQTFDWLRSEKVISHELYARMLRRVGRGRGQILNNHPTFKLVVLLSKGNGLLTEPSSNIHEKGSVGACFTGLVGGWEDIQEGGHAEPIGLHVFIKECQILRVFLQP